MTVARLVLVRRKWAMGVRDVITGGVVLLVGVGSGVGLPTLAVWVTLVPLAGAITVSVRLVLAPSARLPRLDQMTYTLSLHDALPILTNVTLAGKASVTVTLLAALGPRLVTMIV